MRLIALLFLAAASLPAQRPRYGGTLTAETREAIQSLEPAAMPPEIAALIYEHLVVFDAAGAPAPGLAVSWWTRDPAHRRMQLRFDDGVTAHDGSAVTPQIAAAALTIPGRAASASGDVIAIQSTDPAPNLLTETMLVLRGANGSLQGTGPFRVAEFDPGRRLLLAAHETYRGGRPFLDNVEILLGRSHADQLHDLDSGRAQVIDLLPSEARRQQQRGRRVWSSPPRHIIVLAWKRDRPASQNAALREALALSLDRQPMLQVLLQRQGEATGALLPQWLTGYAFLFRTARDLPRAKYLAGSQSVPAVTLQSDPSDAMLRPLADRIALNARDSGLSIRAVAGGQADLSLFRIAVSSLDPAAALEDAARALSAPVTLETRALEGIEQAERRMLADHWIVPLFHVPTLLAVAPQVKDTTPARSLRWRIEDAWLQPQ
jgi:peptide/nickel transport system substrate-binding protein